MVVLINGDVTIRVVAHLAACLGVFRASQEDWLTYAEVICRNHNKERPTKEADQAAQALVEAFIENSSSFGSGVPTWEKANWGNTHFEQYLFRPFSAGRSRVIYVGLNTSVESAGAEDACFIVQLEYPEPSSRGADQVTLYRIAEALCRLELGEQSLNVDHRRATAQDILQELQPLVATQVAKERMFRFEFTSAGQDPLIAIGRKLFPELRASDEEWCKFLEILWRNPQSTRCWQPEILEAANFFIQAGLDPQQRIEARVPRVSPRMAAVLFPDGLEGSFRVRSFHGVPRYRVEGGLQEKHEAKRQLLTDWAIELAESDLQSQYDLSLRVGEKYDFDRSITLKAASTTRELRFSSPSRQLVDTEARKFLPYFFPEKDEVWGRSGELVRMNEHRVLRHVRRDNRGDYPVPRSDETIVILDDGRWMKLAERLWNFHTTFVAEFNLGDSWREPTAAVLREWLPQKTVRGNATSYLEHPVVVDTLEFSGESW
jgi:hypothetical protein